MDRAIGPQGRLARIEQGVRPGPAGSLGADAHETVADCQLLVDGLAIHLKYQAMAAGRMSADIPAQLALAEDPDGANRHVRGVRRLQAHPGPAGQGTTA